MSNIYRYNPQAESSEQRKIIFSDVGDVLMKTSPLLDIQKKCINELFCKSQLLDYTSSLDITYELFLPYKRLSQTSISLQQSIEMFFKEYSINYTYEDYCSLYKKYSEDLAPLKLNFGVVDTMEYIDDLGIDLIFLSDGKETGAELSEKLMSMVVKEKNFDIRKNHNTKRYFKGYYSSKDFGFKKEDPGFIKMLSKEVKFQPKNSAFIGHDSEELFAMASYGMKIFYVDDPKEPQKLFPSSWNRIQNFNNIRNIKDIKYVLGEKSG